MPIRPNALAIALGIHVLIVIAFLVARDWNAEPPRPPEVQLMFTTIETVAPPPVPVVDPAPGASGGPAPTPRPAPAPPRPALKKKVDVIKMDEDMEKRMVDALTSSAPSTTADMNARRPTADLDQAAGGGDVAIGGGGGNGGGLGGLGDGVDLSAKPQPLDTTSASTLPYTKEAMRDHVEGDVTLVLQIDAAGIVTSTAIQRGIGHGLDEIAATVARKFTFKPALDRYGKKTAGSVKWRFHFTRPT